MSTAVSPAEVKPCSYKHGSWNCPFDAQGDHDRCIFHLSVDQKAPEEFWRHLASYLRALLCAEGDLLWVGEEVDDTLVNSYSSSIKPGDAWHFHGFVFPAMDEEHNFRGFVFAATDFMDARFSGEAHFADATFGAWAVFAFVKFDAGACFGGAKFAEGASFFQTEYAGAANFEGATFGAEANFNGTTFSGEADFVDATFNNRAGFFAAKFTDMAVFSRATFNGRADFRIAKLSDKANFHAAKFASMANFAGATFEGEANFSLATFSTGARFWDAKFAGMANFDVATFNGEADFSFAHFLSVLFFREADFKARVDFYEARLPGSSWMLGMDERTARSIRLLAEKHGWSADAGVFYAIEMDYRRRRFRKTPRCWLQYLLMELYRLTSHYGESPGRALASLAVALLLFSYSFVISGFWFMGRRVDRDLWATPSDLWLAFRLALVNLLPGNLPSYIPGAPVLSSPATRTWAVAQVIVTYVLLTMFLLAIRRRFRR